MATGSRRGGARSVLEMTAGVVAAYVGHNPVPARRLPELIESVGRALAEAGGAAAAKPPSAAPRAGAAPEPPVSVRDTILGDFIVCLEDGKALKSLKRHLRARFDMSPEEYRAKWGLPDDYPMVAPNYAKRLSEAAKARGLGRRKRKRG